MALLVYELAALNIEKHKSPRSFFRSYRYVVGTQALICACPEIPYNEQYYSMASSLPSIERSHCLGGRRAKGGSEKVSKPEVFSSSVLTHTQQMAIR